LIYNNITFSSSLEEEYPEYSGGGGVLLGQPLSRPIDGGQGGYKHIRGAYY